MLVQVTYSKKEIFETSNKAVESFINDSSKVNEKELLNFISEMEIKTGGEIQSIEYLNINTGNWEIITRN